MIIGMTEYPRPVAAVWGILSAIKRNLLPTSSLASLAISCVIAVSPADKSAGGPVSPPILAIRFYQKYISDLRSGRCRFEPSCSQYARESIEARGLIVGSALAADRLIRCNRGAVRYHVRGPGGRLLDPVDRDNCSGKKPLVPFWLLPEKEYDLPLGRQADSATSERLIEYADFADVLAAEGDCRRAQTEYERVAYIGAIPNLDFWAHMKTGECLFRQDAWEESATQFSKAADISVPGTERNAACFMVAASHFNSGGYARSKQVLDQSLFQWPVDRTSPGSQAMDSGSTPQTGPSAYSGPDPVTMEDWLFLNGLCSMALGDWDDGAERFKEISMSYPGSPNLDIAIFLRGKSEDGPKLPRRNPTAASVFSAIVPGSGQVYAGHTYDGVRHLVFNCLLGYLVYRAAEDQNYAGTYLLAGITLPFYMGNVLGAKKSVQQFNASKRMDYVREAIEAAPD